MNKNIKKILLIIAAIFAILPIQSLANDKNFSIPVYTIGENVANAQEKQQKEFEYFEDLFQRYENQNLSETEFIQFKKVFFNYINNTDMVSDEFYDKFWNLKEKIEGVKFNDVDFSNDDDGSEDNDCGNNDKYDAEWELEKSNQIDNKQSELNEIQNEFYNKMDIVYKNSWNEKKEFYENAIDYNEGVYEDLENLQEDLENIREEIMYAIADYYAGENEDFVSGLIDKVNKLEDRVGGLKKEVIDFTHEIEENINLNSSDINDDSYCNSNIDLDKIDSKIYDFEFRIGNIWDDSYNIMDRETELEENINVFLNNISTVDVLEKVYNESMAEYYDISDYYTQLNNEIDYLKDDFYYFKENNLYNMNSCIESVGFKINVLEEKIDEVWDYNYHIVQSSLNEIFFKIQDLETNIDNYNENWDNIEEDWDEWDEDWDDIEEDWGEWDEDWDNFDDYLMTPEEEIELQQELDLLMSQLELIDNGQQYNKLKHFNDTYKDISYDYQNVKVSNGVSEINDLREVVKKFQKDFLNYIYTTDMENDEMYDKFWELKDKIDILVLNINSL